MFLCYDIVGAYPIFICWFLNLSSSEERFLFFLLLKWALSFTRLKKSSSCLFIVFLLIVFCVGTKVSLQNLLVLRLTTCPAASDWNLNVSSSIFCNLIKLPWFVRWSLWRWSVRCFFLGPVECRALELLFWICTCVQCFYFFRFFLVIVLCLLQ